MLGIKQVLAMETKAAASEAPTVTAINAAEAEKDRKRIVREKISDTEKGPEGTGAKHDLEDADYTADLVTNGAKVDAGAARQMIAMAEMLSGHAQTLQTAASLIETTKKSGDQTLAALQKILQNFDAFQKGLEDVQRQLGSISVNYGMPH